MHKISSVTKWAYHYVSNNWIGIPGASRQIDLPNKFQKRTIDSSPDLSAAQQSKADTKRGIIHALLLAGELSNNRDENKGYQDIYVDYMDSHRDLPVLRYGRKFSAVAKIRFTASETGTAEHLLS